MIKTFNPSGMVQPASRYSQGVEVSGTVRWLHIAGQAFTARRGTSGWKGMRRRQPIWWSQGWRTGIIWSRSKPSLPARDFAHGEKAPASGGFFLPAPGAKNCLSPIYGLVAGAAAGGGAACGAGGTSALISGDGTVSLTVGNSMMVLALPLNHR